MMGRPVVQHFSDILCIWAYIANARLEHVADRYRDRISIDLRICSVFPDARNKIARSWRDRGGNNGYADHVRQVADGFGHVKVHRDTWSVVTPASSTSVHLFLKAVEAADSESADIAIPIADRPVHRVAWALRCAFFAEARDISDWRIQSQIAEEAGLDIGLVKASLESGEAAARLDRDIQLCQKLNVIGSPTFIMNEGRQILYGNVGAHLIQANIEELFRSPRTNEASWC
jgi:predicted DsbA family dithiol-disulfide isomerase